MCHRIIKLTLCYIAVVASVIVVTTQVNSKLEDFLIAQEATKERRRKARKEEQRTKIVELVRAEKETVSSNTVNPGLFRRCRLYWYSFILKPFRPHP